MALDPKMLDSLPNTLVDLYGLVEIDILEDMARRISSYDYFIPAALHQNQKLQELGMVQGEIIKRLSALTGQTQAEIVELLSEASAEAIEDDIDYYTRADVYEPSKVDTEALYSQLNSGLLQTEQAFFNITRTTANTATKQFERALDRAWLQISTGAFDYNTAVKRAITDLAEAGLGAIEYPSGRVDSIEVAVRRAVVTGANQTALKTQEVLADELEIDLVEVSAHGGARPEHAKWQGKVFSRNGRVTIDGVTYEDFRKATGYGTGAGLGGWNCRHTFFPYVPGASRSWTDKELKALEEKKVTYNGEKYTEYEASQIQRGIERDIRKHKRTVAAIEATGGDASEERAKLRKAQKSYTDFTEQTGMKKQSARTQIASKKAEREAKKAYNTAGVNPSTIKTIEQQRKKSPANPTTRAEIKSRIDELTKEMDASNDINKWIEIESEIESLRTLDKELKQKEKQERVAAVETSLFEKDYFATKSRGKGNAVDITAADEESAKTIEIGCDMVFAKFPKLKGQFLGVSVGDAKGENAFAQTELKYGTITANKKYFSSFSYLSERHAKCVEVGFHPEGVGVEGVIVHEFGHSIALWLQKRGNIAIQQGTQKTIAQKIKKEVLKKMSVDESIIETAVSKYATYSDDEWFAECFSEYICSDNPREMARVFGEVITKHIKETNGAVF